MRRLRLIEVLLYLSGAGSCDPNCYTQIIPSEGKKKIFIYAKRDLAVGEELCYDYKFPMESEPSNRVSRVVSCPRGPM